jgi:hypothetical protein
MITSVQSPPIDVAPTLTALPNPARDELRVRCGQAREGAGISLFNLLGERMLSANAGESGESVLDVSTLCAGVYLLRLRGFAGVATRTVMVVH